MSCKSCKKKKDIKFEESLEVLEIMDLTNNVYSYDEIKEAYYELTSYGGVKEDKKQLISDVYQYIFKEPFDFSCNSCVSRQARKFQHFIKENLKIKI